MKRIKYRMLASLLLAALALAPVSAWAQTAKLGEIPLKESVGSVTSTAADDHGGPRAIAFDGVYIWVARQFANSVVRLNASTGAYAGAFQVGDRPSAVLHAFSAIWVANAPS